MRLIIEIHNINILTTVFPACITIAGKMIDLAVRKTRVKRKEKI